MTVRRSKRWIGFFLLMSAGVLAVVLYSQWDSLRRMALERIDKTFGQSIRFEDLDVFLFPYPRIELTGVLIKKQGVSKVLVLQASRLRIDIEPISSFLDRIVPTEIVLEQPHLVLRRQSKDPWGLSKSISNTPAETAIFQTILLAEELSVVDGHVTIEDMSDPDEPRVLSCQNIALAFSKTSNDDSREMTLSGQIDNQKDRASFALNGVWQQEKGSTIIIQDRYESSLPKVMFAGDIDVLNVDPHQLAEFFQWKDLPSAKYGKVGIQGTFRVVPMSQGYDMTVSKFEVKSQTLAVAGEGRISGMLADEPPTMFWTVSSNSVSLKHLVQLLPPRLLPSSLTRPLNEEKVKGVLTVESAHIAGSSDPDVGFSVVGDFRVDKGFLNLGSKWGTAKEVRGRAVLQSDLLRFFDVRGIYDSIPVVDGEGTIDLRDSNFQMNTVLKGDLSSKKLVEILRKVFDSEHTSPTWASLKGVDGGGIISIRFSGPLASPKAVSFRDARYQAKNGRFKFGTPAHLFTGVTGPVTFSPKHVGFETVSVNFGKSTAQVQGSLVFGKTDRFDAFKVIGNIEVADFVNRMFPDSLFGDSFFGSAHVNSIIAGPLKEPHVHGSLDLLNARMTFPGILEKAKNIPGGIKFKTQVRPHGMFEIDRMTLSILPFQLTGKGAVNLGSPVKVEASLSVGPVARELLPEGVQVGSRSFKSGMLEISLDIKGKGRDWRRWDKSGWVTVTNGVIQEKGLDHPIKDLHLRLKLFQHKATVKRLDFRIKESAARARGVIQNWDHHPIARFDIRSPQFDLDLLIPKGERSPIRDILEKVAATSDVDAQFQFAKAWYKALDFHDVSAKMKIAKGMVDLTTVQGATKSGQVSGRVVVYLPQNTPAKVKTEINVQDVSLEAIQRTFIKPEDLEERLVTGLLSVKGNVEGHGYDPLGVLPTIKGAIDVKVTNGYIQRGTVVPKVLALLNLPTVLQGKVDFQEKGFPFDQSTATLLMDHGVVVSENIVLASPILTMTAAGEYRLLDHHMKLISAVSPFGPYSDLLKKIPLFGLLFDGDREAIDTAMFKISGPVQNPDVAYLPGESFKAGLTGLAKMAYHVLKNTVMLPTKLLTSPSSEDVSSTRMKGPNDVVSSDEEDISSEDQ